MKNLDCYRKKFSDKPNRNPLSSFFITFPQCGEITRIEFTEKLFTDKDHKDKIMTVRETHSDGGYHLHLITKLSKKITKSQLLNKLEKIYPDDYKRIDVQILINWAKAIEYLKKEDMQPYLVNVTLVDTSKNDPDFISDDEIEKMWFEDEKIMNLRYNRFCQKEKDERFYYFYDKYWKQDINDKLRRNGIKICDEEYYEYLEIMKDLELRIYGEIN